MDCGDNSCQYEGRNRGGMRTNGGCYCLKDLDFDKRMRAMGYIRHLEAEVERLRLERVDADHDWALWHEKWIAALDLMGSQSDRATKAEAKLAEEQAEVERLRAELDRPRHETLRQLADAVERNERLKAEVERLRSQLDACNASAAETERQLAGREAAIKGAHGALTDAATVIVPGSLDGDLAPAIRQLTRERDEARSSSPATPDTLAHEWRKSAIKAALDAVVLRTRERDEARAEVERSHAAILALTGEVERLRGVLGLVLTETGLQAHKHGCPERLRRPAQWDQTLPCAGCAAEAALRTEEGR